MKATPFNPKADLAPIPFDSRHCRVALQLKEAGLVWQPHAGCFVWDRDRHIPVPSPFPGQIYFVLNVERFLGIFESVDNMKEKLV